MNSIDYIKKSLPFSDNNIKATLKLLAEDCTIPFISRYRKDATGNLDEVQIEGISKLNKQFEEIIKRKESILKSIEEQDFLTSDLKQRIDESFDLQELEDLYLPFKKRRKTKADAAKEKGLEPLAKIIMSQNANHLQSLASKYLNDQIESEEDALQGARDIMAEWINENMYVRKNLRRLFQRQAMITSKIVKAKMEEEAAQKFKQYFEWQESLNRIPSHRLLAMLRAEAEGFVKTKIEIDKEEALDFIEHAIIKSNNECSDQIFLAIKDSYKRLLEPAISNEALQ